MPKTKLKDCPYHSEELWALVRAQVGGTTEMCYLMQPTRKQLWQVVIEQEWFGTGYTKEMLQREGFRATRVRIEEIGR